MKKIFASILLLIIELGMFAQTPPSFNYQAILRDASGNVLANKEVNIGIVILQGNTTGNQVFTETHPVTTNEFGLVNLQIGSVNTAEIQAIDWNTGPYFIQISVDGTAMGTSQLLSVPFAMHAITVENDAVNDDDSDPKNEIQVLSIHADTIFLSSGGFVILPSETDPDFTNWDRSSGISISEAQISDLKHFNGDSITGYETVFDGWDKNADNDFTSADETDPVFSNSLAAAINAADTTLWAKDTNPQNELQNLKLENQQLSISDGNTIDLSGAYYIADSSATNELQDITLNGTQLSISKGSTIDLTEVQDGDKQRLSLGVSNQHEIRLNISNANYVEMPFVKDGVSKYNWDEAENYVAKWEQYGSMGKSTIYDNGNVGVGTSSPNEKLEVNGAIVIGNSSADTTKAGTIRWNPETNDFEGFTGKRWRSLTAGSIIYGNSEGNEISKHIADDPIEDNHFGASVSISGDYAIVGAPYNYDKASAYIFHHTDIGWEKEAKLIASDGADNYFGNSVSISGDYAIIGANEDDERKGSAYIFHRSGTTWTQQQKITAGDGQPEDYFGISVSISGDYAIVGSPYNEKKGAAYIFHRSDTNWEQQAKLIAPDGAEGDHFGEDVSISGDFVIVGAWGDDDKGINSGSAYVFQRSGTSWPQQQKLTASNGAPRNDFGENVSISGDYAIINTIKGQVYIFYRSDTGWTQQTILTSTFNDNFGYDVAISGKYAIVGAPRDDDHIGAVYIYERSGVNWMQKLKLKASNGNRFDDFGTNVSIFEDYVIVGAQGDNYIGAVYFF